MYHGEYPVLTTGTTGKGTGSQATSRGLTGSTVYKQAPPTVVVTQTIIDATANTPPTRVTLGFIPPSSELIISTTPSKRDSDVFSTYWENDRRDE